MPQTIRLALACLAAIAMSAVPAHAQGGTEGPPGDAPAAPAPELVVDSPVKRTLIFEGQASRYLLGGQWYFRQDDEALGMEQRLFAQRSLVGWTPIAVPYSWNATDTTLNRSSTGWYRKEFKLPRAPKGKRGIGWKLRFEGSNYRTTVWLNGRRIQHFTGYFPFEAELTGLRRGRNSLVVKVSSLRSRTDLTHWRAASFNGYGTGGWWNFGGLLREVYVRRVDTVDIEDVRVLPRMRCPRCPARVEVRVLLHNITRKDRKVALTLNVGGERIELGGRGVAAGARREVRTRFTIRRPRLWQPGSPKLYTMRVGAAVDGDPRSGYRLRFGVRHVDVRPGGIVRLNGRRVQLRGASIHEDDDATGGALTPGTRRLLIGRLRDLGATLTRSHYPLHPAFLEAFDRRGIMYWVDAPVYQLPNAFFDLASVRRSAARAARLTVRENSNHPSVLAWSLVNEPAGSRGERGVVGPGLERYIRDAAAEVRELDDTRLVAIDRHSRMGEPLTHPAYRHLDALGVNEYFGWYDSVHVDLARPPSTTEELGPYLDELHAANPDLPLFITEFGAEGLRSGPVEQRGSYEFQREFVRAHLAIHASKRYVNGSIHWALRDFRVQPTWQGGAPADWSSPPWHNKSLIEEHNGRKPVYFLVRDRFRRTKPLR